jgi:hypothetical protein
LIAGMGSGLPIRRGGRRRADAAGGSERGVPLIMWRR